MIFDVLGLGESLKEFQLSENLTIGVNDIAKYHHTDYFVCVDRPRKFTETRLKNIINNRGEMFTHLEEWLSYRDCNIIELTNGRGLLDDLDSNLVCHSTSSTYVAVVIAYKLGATEMNIYGADFNTHKAFNGNMLESTLKDFKLLFDTLKNKGIKINVTKESKLNLIL